MAQSSSHEIWRLAILATVMGLAALAVQQVKPAAADDPDSPVQPPGARCCVGMAYFPGSVNATFMYGGLDTQGDSQSDTWMWNGTGWSSFTTGANPGPRSSGRMVYDGNLDVIVLFGGQNCVDGSCTLSDDSTWFFDPRKPASERWQLCGCPDPNPGARTSEALGYHFDGQYTLLFGGAAGGVKRNDTWELVGTSVLDANWDQQFPATVPARRASAELAFFNTANPATHQMVMFGGNVDPALTPSNETWFWTGTDWSQQAPANSPSPRFGHRMAYNDALERIMVFGAGEPTETNDLWFWNGSNWVICGVGNGCTTTPPLPRCCMGMAYDQLRDDLVIYAGGFGVTPQAYPDTWLWDFTQSWRCAHNCGL